MGLEAVCICHVGEESAEAKVLLESCELILRAPFRRTIQIAGIAAATVVGESLLLTTAGDDEIRLDLGAAAAAKWAKKILTPAPSLASKLGVGHASPALLIGTIDDPALAEALDGHVAPAETARLSVAIVPDSVALDAALAQHAALPPRSPIWIIHGKGPKATFGEGPVRAHMRALGYRDNKVSAVSERLSATRYTLG